MRFWDASALVKLCVHEVDTDSIRVLAQDDIVAWSGSAVEIASAIERRAREGSLSPTARVAARETLGQLVRFWTEISALAPVRERAMRLVATHPLRAADALQLAAALVAVSDRPEGHEFVCVDARLREAATREGFCVLPIGEPVS